MPFPQAERVIFDHNPLDLVVTQFQFPPILSIATQEPAGFQEPIRADYPLYTREDVLLVPPELEPLLAKLGRPPQSVRHAFRTADQQRTIYLTRDFLAVEEKRYERWENFRAEGERTLRMLVELYEPAFFTRIGLRYVNVIRRSDLGLSPDLPWSRLVEPAFIGMLGLQKYQERVKESVAATTLRLEDAPKSAVRVHHGIHPVGFEGGPEETYFIDADFFTEERTNVADTLNVLDALHAHSGNLFRWVISDELHTALRPRSVDRAVPRVANIGRMAEG